MGATPCGLRQVAGSRPGFHSRANQSDRQFGRTKVSRLSGSRSSMPAAGLGAQKMVAGPVGSSSRSPRCCL